ncbi:MAG TPA: flagellar biosynthetic protein FliR [Pseudomonadales bacterium]|nr:flagellar biosynthetic protein FliR [Pseudomonadales bacterium]
MIALDAVNIGGWVGQYLWPFFRLASFFMAMPLIGSRNVPRRIRLVLAAFTAMLIAPVIPDMPKLDALSWTAILVVMQQILIGTLLGFFLQLFFQLFIMAGQMISMQVGLGMATMMDPINGASVPILGQMYLIFTTLMFFVFDGHLIMLEIFAYSFYSYPVSADPYAILNYVDIAAWGAWLFQSSFAIALPIVTAVLVVNFSFGFISRAAPQMNIFALGFPLTMLMGLFIIWIAVAAFQTMFESHFADALHILRSIVMTR